MLSAFVQADRTAVVVSAANVTITATKLSAAGVGAGGATVVPVNGTQAEVTVPASVFADLGVGDVVLVVSVFNASVAASMSDGGQSGSGGAAQPTEVKAAVNVNLASSTGSPLTVSGLSEPIEVVLPVNFTVGLECAYWDEQRLVWATDGLSAPDTTPEGLLLCRTTHLSLFAGIWRGFVSTYECSQVVTLLNAEAISQLLEGDWYRSTGAIFLWIVLAVMFVMLLLMRCLDRERRKHGMWHDEHFLIPIGTEADSVPRDEEIETTPRSGECNDVEAKGTGSSKGAEEEQPKRGILMACLCLPAVACCACVNWMRESSAFRDALDDIMSNWVANFSEIRDTLEGFWEGLDLFAHESDEDGGIVFILLHKMMRSLLLSSTRRQACASLRVSGEVVSFLMEDEDITDVLLSRHERHMSMSSSMPTGHHMAAQETHASAEATPANSKGFDGAEPTVAKYISTGSTGSMRVLAKAMSKAALASKNAHATGDSEARAVSNSSEAITASVAIPPIPSAHSSAYSAHSTHTHRTVHREENWGRLHEALNDHLDQHIVRTGRWRAIPCIVSRLFVIQNPIGSSMLHCVFMSSTLRFFLFALEIFGALMLGTVFFQASGQVQGRKKRARCGNSSTGPWEQVGRIFAIGAASLVVAGIPVAILNSLHNRGLKKFSHEGCPEWHRQLRIWRIQDRIIWCLGVAYLLFSIWFMCVFMSNVSDQDLHSWMVSGVVTLALNILILPFIIAFFVPILAASLLSTVSCVKRKPKRELIRESHAVLKSPLTLPQVHI